MHHAPEIVAYQAMGHIQLHMCTRSRWVGCSI